MRVGFIGGGNMAEAMLGGMLKQGFAPSDLRVTEPNPVRRADLESRFGVLVEASPQQTLAVDVLVLAVKPQILREVLVNMPKLAAETCVLSIAAGVRAVDIRRWLNGHEQVVRAMPNTPALVGAGVAGLYALPAVHEAQRARAAQVLDAVGQTLWVAEESLLDAVTALSGSGPAYVFLFMETLSAAGRALGLDKETARTLALRTVHGAAELALHDGSEPATLRARVTSEGGTTERGIAVLQEHGLESLVIEAARAAAARAAELGNQLGAQ